MITLHRGYNKITVGDFLDTIKRGTKGSKIEVIEVIDEIDESGEVKNPKLYNIITIKTNAAKTNNTVYIEIEEIKTEENNEENSGENSGENTKKLNNILIKPVDLNYKIYSRLLSLLKDNVIQFIGTDGTKYQLNKIEYTTNRYSRTEFPWLYYSIDKETGNLDKTHTVKDNLKIYIKAI
jgi:hypothetical protein